MKNILQFYSRKKNGAIQSPFFTWVASFATLLFPARCKICAVCLDSNEKAAICDCCYATFTRMQKPCCPVCGLMFMKSGGRSHLCAGCRSKPPYFARARSLFRYCPGIDRLIHQFKFNGDLSLLHSFGYWFKEYQCVNSPADYIVPVPLHPARIRQRGFNQSALLAKQFFGAEKHKIKHLLERTFNTVPQTKLSGIKRRRNLKNCFKLVHGYELKGKIVYLVDDVYTTGTTVNECAKILIKAGVDRVEVFTLAMVVKENEL